MSYSTRTCLFGKIAGSDHILILENVQVENSGIYTCDLANVLGHVSAQVHLIVAETKDYLSAGSGEALNFHQINVIEFLCESIEQTVVRLEWKEEIFKKLFIVWIKDLRYLYISSPQAEINYNHIQID